MKVALRWIADIHYAAGASYGVAGNPVLGALVRLSVSYASSLIEHALFYHHQQPEYVLSISVTPLLTIYYNSSEAYKKL
jgi:hypothetical protein